VICLCLDEGIDPAAAAALRRGHDVVSAHDVGMAGTAVADGGHLAYAVRERRVLLTFNIKDYAPRCDAWWQQGRAHPGIVVSRQYPRAQIGEFIRLVESLLKLATEEELANRLRFLSEFDV
jgi:hypothetical protein